MDKGASLFYFLSESFEKKKYVAYCYALTVVVCGNVDVKMV